MLTNYQSDNEYQIVATKMIESCASKCQNINKAALKVQESLDNKKIKLLTEDINRIITDFNLRYSQLQMARQDYNSQKKYLSWFTLAVVLLWFWSFYFSHLNAGYIFTVLMASIGGFWFARDRYFANQNEVLARSTEIATLLMKSHCNNR
jgi:hypothetical protein